MPLPEFTPAEEIPQEEQEAGTESENQGEESLDSKLSKVQQSVQQTVQQGLQQNSQLVSLLADPDIQEVLRRKQQGQPVFQGPQEEEKEEPAPNFEEMTQAQIVQYMAKQNQKLVRDVVTETVKPLVEELNLVKGTVRQSVEEKAVNAVQAAQQKYVDFEQHRPAMIQLQQRHPNATIDELYALSCFQAGKAPQLRSAQQDRERRSSSERPSHTTARPSSKPVPKGLSSREAFNFALSNALKNIDTTGLENE